MCLFVDVFQCPYRDVPFRMGHDDMTPFVGMFEFFVAALAASKYPALVFESLNNFTTIHKFYTLIHTDKTPCLKASYPGLC